MRLLNVQIFPPYLRCANFHNSGAILSRKTPSISLADCLELSSISVAGLYQSQTEAPTCLLHHFSLLVLSLLLHSCSNMPTVVRTFDQGVSTRFSE